MVSGVQSLTKGTGRRTSQPAMAGSSSGSSSFASSSFGGAPSNFTQAFVSPGDSTFTPASVSHVSSFTQDSSGSGQTPLRPLDLGPPGYQATM